MLHIFNSNKNNNMTKIFNDWLHKNVNLINTLKKEFGNKGFIDVLYNTEEFEQLVASVNNNTEEEETFVNGWTDDKDELFYDMLITFVRLTK